jgi:very-short-patch-repair endonuclease
MPSGDAMKRLWQNPGYRCRQLRQQKLGYTDAIREQMSQSTKRRWAEGRGPVWTEERNQKLSETKHRLGQRPRPSRGARRLKRLLGRDWILEYRIANHDNTTKWYQVDLANLKLTAVIEVDGKTHDRPAQRKRDRARDAGLRQLGWTVIRIREEER